MIGLIIGTTAIFMANRDDLCIGISILPFHFSDHFIRSADILASLMTFNGIMVIGLQLWLTNKTQHMLAYRIIGLSYALYAAASERNIGIGRFIL